MENERDEIEILTQKIIKEIHNDPANSVSILKSVLLGDKQNTITYEEYLANLQKTLKKSACQGCWTSDQLLIHCLDCQKNKSSCICVNCFLKGNHQGHKILITHSSSASCDCGDPLFWSPSGFCSDHPGPDPHPEMSQLTKDTRIKLITLSKASLMNYLEFARKNPFIFYQITKFLSNLVSIGDAPRRCVSLVIMECFSVFELYESCYNLEKKAIDELIEFLGKMPSDEVFRKAFSLSFLNDLPKFIAFNDDYGNKEEKSDFVDTFYTFTFHAATIPMTCELIQKSSFDFITIYKISLEMLMKFNFMKLTRDYMVKSQYFDSNDRIMTILKSAISVLDNKDSKLIQMVNNHASVIVNHEFAVPLKRVFGDKYNDPIENQGQIFQICFFLFHCNHVISKKNVYSEEPLQLISEFFKKQNFELIDKDYIRIGEFDNDIYFHSVLNENVQFAQFFPTHILAFECLNLKEKSLIDYVKSVTDDVEKFLKNWAIIPLRFLAAADLSYFRFFVRNSTKAIVSLDSFKYRRSIKFKFAPTFAFIQTLFKSTKNPDDFLLMIMATYGLFNVIINTGDCLDENQQRLILLLIYHFVLCLIFDTSCVEKDFFSMQRLCIISALMKEDLTIEEIESLWYKRVSQDDRFMDELHSFTSKITTRKDSKYHLTNNSEWHPILPFMTISTIIPLIQKFIHDNPDSLINFPELPKDSINLLFIPTFWAFEFYILSHKCCKDYQIIQQLIFNTLIITSQHSEQFYQDTKVNNNDDDSDIIAHDFLDLAANLKNLTFIQFMKKKISVESLNEGVQKSMIDLISLYGKIGIIVLTRMNITININSPEENQQMKEEMMMKNKKRAKMIKMQIMNNFNKKQKSFQSHVSEKEEEEDLDEKEDNSKMECSICHLENEDDCFVYPAFFYKSPLSSYIKWRFRNAKLVNINQNNEDSNNNDFSNIPDSFDTFNSVLICLHPIHSKCIQKNLFNCPTDRCIRNASIPIIAGIFDEKSELESHVLDAATNFLKKAYFNDLKFAVYSLASQIEIIEMRLRLNPGCFDDPTIQVSLRNIYLCLWHVMRNESTKILQDDEIQRQRTIISQSISNEIQNNDSTLTWSNIKNSFIDSENLPDIDKNLSVDLNVINIMNKLHPEQSESSTTEEEEEEDEKQKRKNIHLSPLMKYIFTCLKTNDKIDMNKFIDGKFLKMSSIKNDNEELFKDIDIIEDLNSDYKMLQFLRCVAIFDHFARDNKITQSENENELIDWDLILSSSYLCNHYSIAEKNLEIFKNDEMTLPMFSFIDLPKSFLDFIHPPYSAPILEYDKHEIMICLLTGKTVVINTTETDMSVKYKNLNEFMKKQFNGSFSIFLKLNGFSASQVALSSLEISIILFLQPFYTDKFGDKDIGMKRGSLLYMNESKKEETIDNFLSGLWINTIQRNLK